MKDKIGKTSVKKQIEFDLFQDFVDLSVDQSKQQPNQAALTFNFNLSDGTLSQGYGFKQLQMPTSVQDLQKEEVVKLAGDKVYSVWPLGWFDNSANCYKYYVVYFNDQNKICFANLFEERPFLLSVETGFTKTPIGSSAKYKGNDALIFSTDDKKGLHLLSGVVSQFFEDAPSIYSMCCQYENLYAIAKNGREKLVYSQNQEVTEWSENQLGEIKFNDELGRLNKVIALNDYVYVFRDFGINKISIYSTRVNYDISRIYQSDSYINGTTIASSGDKIYFLDGSGVCSFNGSSVSKLNFGCQEMLARADLSNASAACFQGKYFLCCRYDFEDGTQIGCEKQADYVNNCLFIFDLENKKTNLVRGVDVKGLCVLNNPYKSKIVACFNGENCGKIGELTVDGKVFDQTLPKIWTSVRSDFGFPEKLKSTKYICLKTSADCKITISSERGSRAYQVRASDKIQRLRVDVTGKELAVSIESQEQQIKISNVKLGVILV